MREFDKNLLDAMNAEGAGILIFPDYLFFEPAFRRYLVKLENMFSYFSGKLIKVGFSVKGHPELPSYEKIKGFLEELDDSYGIGKDVSFPLLVYKKRNGEIVSTKGVYAL